MRTRQSVNYKKITKLIQNFSNKHPKQNNTKYGNYSL